MNKKICPLCGNPIDEEEDGLFCPQCSDNAKKREETDIFFEEEETASETDFVEDTESEKDEYFEEAVADKKERRRPDKKYFFIFSALAILIAASVVLVLLYKRKEKEKEGIEMTFWFACIEKNTPQSYSKYLFEYPKGKFSTEAQQKITELRNAETEDWNKLKKSVKLDDYFSFLNKYPNTPFKNEVKHVMDSLSWVIAEKENTTESYLVYLENYKLGNITGYYSALAQERHNYLKTIKRIDGEELLTVKEAIRNYFQFLSSQNYDKLSGTFTVVVSNFYGERNFSSTKIIRAIQSDIQRNAIKNLTYTPQLENITISKDSSGLYFADVNIEKKVTFGKKKTTESTKELLRMELTPELSIKSVFLTSSKDK